MTLKENKVRVFSGSTLVEHSTHNPEIGVWIHPLAPWERKSGKEGEELLVWANALYNIFIGVVYEFS